MSKERLETFSRGIFASAITLLVLTIAQPRDYSHLARDLANGWPSYAAYAVSFAVIGIMWLNHHSIFSHFSGVDRGLGNVWSPGRPAPAVKGHVFLDNVITSSSFVCEAWCG